MNKFFYGFMLCVLALVVVYWFIDGRPMDEGYLWLFGAWALLLGGVYWYDHRKPNLNNRG